MGFTGSYSSRSVFFLSCFQAAVCLSLRRFLSNSSAQLSSSVEPLTLCTQDEQGIRRIVLNNPKKRWYTDVSPEPEHTHTHTHTHAHTHTKHTHARTHTKHAHTHHMHQTHTHQTQTRTHTKHTYAPNTHQTHTMHTVMQKGKNNPVLQE